MIKNKNKKSSGICMIFNNNTSSFHIKYSVISNRSIIGTLEKEKWTSKKKKKGLCTDLQFWFCILVTYLPLLPKMTEIVDRESLGSLVFIRRSD